MSEIVGVASRCGEAKMAARALREMIALSSIVQQGWKKSKFTKESFIRVGEKVRLPL